MVHPAISAIPARPNRDLVRNVDHCTPYRRGKAFRHPMNAMADGPVFVPPSGRLKVLALVGLARAVLSTIVVIALYYVVPLGWLESTHPLLALVVAGVLMIVIVTAQVYAITRSELPGVRAVEALGTSIPLVLVGFAAVYHVMSSDNAAAFSEPLDRTDSLYFALTTFTTVGFGDIVAVTRDARIAAMVQMAVNLLIIGVGARVILGAVSAGRSARSQRTG
jgi:voltage-gated potassium channel